MKDEYRQEPNPAPLIVIYSGPDDPVLDWASAGWNCHANGTADTVKARRMIHLASQAILLAADPLDAAERLRKEGFGVVFQHPEWYPGFDHQEKVSRGEVIALDPLTVAVDGRTREVDISDEGTYRVGTQVIVTYGKSLTMPDGEFTAITPPDHKGVTQ